MIKKVVLIGLVIIWAALIFKFSSQAALTSNEVSTGVTEKIVDLSPQIKNLPPNQKEPIIKSLNDKVRKYAHFTLFFIFGILVILLIKCYGCRQINSLTLALLICLLYAISDEIHQIFVPARGCQWQDVLIDFSGSFLGIIIILGVLKLKSILLKSG